MTAVANSVSTRSMKAFVYSLFVFGFGVMAGYLLALPPADDELRGEVLPSTDGHSYLSVEALEFPDCELYVTGERWVAPLHTTQRIIPGDQWIGCAVDIRREWRTDRGDATSFSRRRHRVHHPQR